MNCQLGDIEKCDYVKIIREKLDSYQLCVENSLQEISALNVRYEHRVNELSTIINIFEYINKVTDYKNLFSIINDMLIGVLGATSSTIFKYSTGHFSVEASSLPRQTLIKMEAVGDMLLKNFGNERETFILAEDDLRDGSSASRGTKSAVAVPLAGKEGLMGIIYLEHTKENYFQQEAKRYLNTLAIAIRLALENAQLYSKLEEMALIDGLTGLYNRMFFNKEIVNCMDDYRRFSLPFVLVILDLDYFKKINDTYGHLCGDMVLQQVSNLIRNEIRKDDFVCRYGGEEFAIIFRNTMDMEGIEVRLEEIRRKLEVNKMEYQGNAFAVTASFGAVCCTLADKTDTIEEIVKLADEALYEAKRAGRNRICIG